MGSEMTAPQGRSRDARLQYDTTEFDPFLPLRALAAYSGLSVRKLRNHLDDAGHPLPCYRVGGKILVRRSEFDAWMAAYRHHHAAR